MTTPPDTHALLIASATPRIAPAAAEMIRAAGLRHGGAFEVAFRCSFDDRTQQVTAAVPVFRGGRSRALYLSHQFRAGEMMLHTHPNGTVEPSDADIAAAGACARDGVGFAICDPAATTLFVVTSPADVGLRTSPPTPAMRAWSKRIRMWSRTFRGWNVSLKVMPPIPSHLESSPCP